MFYGATEFNGDLGAWDVSKVWNMVGMFYGATAVYGDLGGGEVSDVSIVGGMFDGAIAFNADLGAWDVSKVWYMGGMFNGATAFNGDLSTWDVSKVWGMQMMFHEATAFDRYLGWYVDKCIPLIGVFYGTKCADGVESAEDDYFYYAWYNDDFTNEAEAVAMAAACGVDVRADC